MADEKQTYIELLENQIEELNIEIERLKTLIPKGSVEEDLLIREILFLDKESQNNFGLSSEKTKQLKLLIDALVAVRRLDRGLTDDKNKKVKNEDVAKLLQIVKNGTQE